MQKTDKETQSDADADKAPPGGTPVKRRTKEVGGPKGPEPTRYGDWERDGRCVDF